MIRSSLINWVLVWIIASVGVGQARDRVRKQILGRYDEVREHIIYYAGRAMTASRKSWREVLLKGRD